MDLPPPHALPRYYQRDLVAALVTAIRERPGETLTVMCPRQSGKNEISAMLVGALLMASCEQGGAIIVCAPTATPQVAISRERTWAYLQRRLLKGSGTLPWRDAAGRVGLGLAHATFLSASPRAHVAGHTASIALLADEAQEIDTAWFERQFRPMAAWKGATVVLFGTAWDGQSLLERAVDRNRRLDAADPVGPRRHYQVGWEEVAAGNLAYRRHVEHERERLGARHPLFLTQYALEPAQGGGRLFSDEQAAALEGRHPRLRAPARGERYAAGLDLGGVSPTADASVLTIGCRRGDSVHIVEQRAWRGLPYADQIALVADTARRWGLARICADATGLGGPMVASLRDELGESAVEPVTFTAALKSALGWDLLGAANGGSLRLWANDHTAEAAETRRQVRECRAATRPGGGLAWGDDRNHDDHLVSLALCQRAVQRLPAQRRAAGRSRRE